MEGYDGIEKRKRVMQSLRDNIPSSFGGAKVAEARDYKAGKVKNLINNSEYDIDLPPSDVLYYVLENEDKIIVRPSGTEPKIKIYVLAHSDDPSELSDKVARYSADAKAKAEV
jgi:phosphoglucomutase